jgi:hypothetical protein
MQYIFDAADSAVVPLTKSLYNVQKKAHMAGNDRTDEAPRHNFAEELTLNVVEAVHVQRLVLRTASLSRDQGRAQGRPLHHH